MAQAAVMTVSEDQAFGYDVFLSYNSAQKDWTRALARRLRSDNYRVFFDEWEMPKYIGQTWMDVLAEYIEKTPKIILVWSPEFFDGEWTRFENNVLQLLDPIGERKKVLPLIPAQCDLPKRFKPQQALWFSMIDDAGRPADPRSIDFDFRYQQLLYNLDRTQSFEGDFEIFKSQYEEKQIRERSMKELQLRENQSKVINGNAPRLSPEDQSSQLFELSSVIHQAPATRRRLIS